ncbi:MAG: hypothetical protein KGI79_01815 [Patescibacteria group bacterium]|nr:hypothetical protein [Patescibacteria group bacterium]MDE2116588.1 hypothetical protein [Patescibacteria group bacterium]
MEGTPQNRELGIDAGTVFGGNRHFAFIYKKTEKLVTAVYMITNFIKDNEPLKWKIRDAALSLLELNLDWGSVSLSERRDLLKEYRALALEIVSFSSIAHHSGLISEMNFSILAREFENLVSTMERDENKRESEQTVILDPGFFDTAEPEPLKRDDKGQSSRTSISPKTQVAIAPVQVQKMSRTPEKPERTMESKDSRQATIIKLLSKKSGLNIKDFAEIIKGVSEKTIQRELLAMVAAGVLKKEGERRWSTYSLAS